MALGILVSRLMAETGMDYDELAPMPRVATAGGPQRIDPDTFRAVLAAGIEASNKCFECGRVYRKRNPNHVLCADCKGSKIGQTRDFAETG